jgi:hypothetical protein
MGKNLLFVVCLSALSVTVPAFSQRVAVSGGRPAPQSGSHTYYARPTVGGASYSYGGYYPAFGSVLIGPNISSPLDVPPQGWWASPYPSQNPCQAACNPNAGYEWDSVGTLILETNPPTAKVVLDGIPAGTTDKLGPFQLPVGEHTLHIEYPGFEPTDVIVKFDRPGVQNLNIDLKRTTAFAKPAPRP